MSVELYNGDLRDVLPFFVEDNSIDACVCDPPYELTSARPGGRSAATRGKVMGGFMGMTWDATGVAFDPAAWGEVLRVLKPGAHLLAFGGTRTFHRIACAIEDAGFELRDCLMWVYGSGFPKSKNLADEWEGWGTALKPAYEPIILARKPLSERNVAANVARWGTGALNIEACRIGEIDGRWPANLIHDGSGEALAAFPDAAFPDAAGQLANASLNADARKTQNVYGVMRRGRGDESSADSENQGAVGFKMRPGARRLDGGSAARFFYCAKASRADRNEGCAELPDRPGGMVSEGGAPGLTKNNHPTVKPTALMRYLCRLVTPPGGVVLDQFMGSGSTGRGAVLEGFRFLGVEQDTEHGYFGIAQARIAAAHVTAT